MNGYTAAVLTAIAVLTAVTVYQLQVHLEHWDRQRHIED